MIAAHPLAPLLSNKRGVTETVAYVALVIVAFGISVLLYSYLQLNAPKERPACPEGVSIAVQDTSCLIKPKPSGTQSDLTITLTNNGRRTLSGAYVRLGTADQKVKGLLNENKIFFPATADSPESAALAPGKSITQRYQGGIAGSVVGNYALEIEPVVGTPGSLALCESAVITKNLECDYPKPKSVPPFATGDISLFYFGIYRIREGAKFNVAVKPEESYADAVNYLEVSMKKKSLSDRTTWEDVYWSEGGTSIKSKKTYEPNDAGVYLLQDISLNRGEHELFAYLVLYSGEKIKVQDRRPGYSRFPFDFPVYSSLNCRQDEKGVTYVPATTDAIYDNSIRETNTNSCSGNTFVEHACGYIWGSAVTPYVRTCAWACTRCAPSSDGVGRCEEGKGSTPIYCYESY